MDKTITVKDLLQKPLWQMSGEEYVALHAYACTIINGDSTGRQTQVLCKGVHALAQYCSCSASQIFKLLREGVLDAAIRSRVGKSIVFDGEVALRCAAEYQEQQRISRKLTK